MKRSLRLLLGALALVALLFTLVPLSGAHPTPGDIRTKAGCNTIVKPGKRKACKACVTKPAPHHFHRKAAAGNRCRPNNGKP